MLHGGNYALNQHFCDGILTLGSNEVAIEVVIR
jgi:hypothetical protein